MTSIEVFNRFDTAAAAEAARTAPTDFPTSLKRLRKLIDLLPQRAVIEDKHAERWLNRTMEMAITRMELEHGEGKATIGDVHEHVLWHVRRASAIGGSEIGTVVRHFRGEKGGFSNARNLTLEKLLILAPQAGDEAMNRGVRAEPWLQKMFLADVDAVSDVGVLDVLKGFRDPATPQMVGTPDDFVVYNEDGYREIDDYKCPSAAVNEEYEKKGMVSFDYVCQLHQYGFFCRKAGIQFDGMAVRCFDPRSFRIIGYQISHDAELEAEMIRGADTLWNDFVMKGAVPVPPGLGVLDTEDDETLKRLRELTMQAAVLKVIGTELSAREQEVLSRIQAIGRDAHALNEGKIDLGFAKFDRNRSWDLDILEDLANRADVDIEDFRSPSDKLDPKEAEKMLADIFAAGADDLAQLPGLVEDMMEAGGLPYKKTLDVDALIARLEELDIDVSPAAGISEKFTLSRSKKNADDLRRIREQAIDLSDAIEDVVEDKAAGLLLPDEIDDLEGVDL